MTARVFNQTNDSVDSLRPVPTGKISVNSRRFLFKEKCAPFREQRGVRAVFQEKSIGLRETRFWVGNLASMSDF